MVKEIEWEGHKIQIDNQRARRFLWLATESIAWVDGVELGRACGLFMTDRLRRTFIHNGQPIELYLEVKDDIYNALFVPYKLYIGGNLISEGELARNNWMIPLVIHQPEKKIKYRYRSGSCSMILGAIVAFAVMAWIVSIIISVLTRPGGYSSTSGSLPQFVYTGFIVIGWLSFSGILWGLIGFFEKHRNLRHATLGFILSGVVFAGWLLLMISGNRGH